MAGHRRAGICPERQARGNLWRAVGRFWPGRNVARLDDVGATLRELKERGYALGVASNFDARLRRVMAGHAELAALERCFISSEVGHRKPSPRFFESIEKELRLPPEAILMVGDDYENDFVAAGACGWRAAWVDRSGKRAGKDGVSAISDLGFLI